MLAGILAVAGIVDAWELRELWRLDAAALREEAGSTEHVVFVRPSRDVEANQPAVTVMFLDDFDGDGIPELLIGDPGDVRDVNDMRLAPGLAGAAYVVDGARGVLDAVLCGPRTGGHFGFSLARVGDLDGDGRGDVVIGAPGSFEQAGAVHAFSSDDWQPLWTTVGHLGDGFGFAVAPIARADGAVEIAAAAPFASPPLGLGPPPSTVDPRDVPSDHGAVHVLDAHRLVTRSSFGVARTRRGFALTAFPDVDDDGIAEIVAKDDTPRHFWYGCGVSVLGGRRGDVLHHVDPPTPYDHFGVALAAVTDDAAPRIAVGAHGYTGPGAVSLHALDGTLLWRTVGRDAECFGWDVTTVPDLDGDGCDEVLAACRNANAVRLLGGRSGEVLMIDERPSRHAYVYDLAATRTSDRVLVALGGRDFVRVCELAPIRDR